MENVGNRKWNSLQTRCGEFYLWLYENFDLYIQRSVTNNTNLKDDFETATLANVA